MNKEKEVIIKFNLFLKENNIEKGLLLTPKIIIPSVNMTYRNELTMLFAGIDNAFEMMKHNNVPTEIRKNMINSLLSTLIARIKD